MVKINVPTDNFVKVDARNVINYISSLSEELGCNSIKSIDLTVTDKGSHVEYLAKFRKDLVITTSSSGSSRSESSNTFMANVIKNDEFYYELLKILTLSALKDFGKELDVLTVRYSTLSDKLEIKGETLCQK